MFYNIVNAVDVAVATVRQVPIPTICLSSAKVKASDEWMNEWMMFLLTCDKKTN